jgi:hypothetical protein
MELGDFSEALMPCSKIKDLILIRIHHLSGKGSTYIESMKLNSVGTAMVWTPRFDSQHGQEIFLLSRAFRAAQAYPAPYPMAGRGIFLGVKQPERKVHTTLPSSTAFNMVKLNFHLQVSMESGLIY